MVVFVGKPMIQCWLFVNRRFTSRPRSKRQIVPPVFRAVLQSGEEVRLAVFLLVVQGLWQGDPTKLHRLSPMIVMTLNGSRNRWVPRSLYIYIWLTICYIYILYTVYITTVPMYSILLWRKHFQRSHQTSPHVSFNCRQCSVDQMLDQMLDQMWQSTWLNLPVPHSYHTNRTSLPSHPEPRRPFSPLFVSNCFTISKKNKNSFT